MEKVSGLLAWPQKAGPPSKGQIVRPSLTLSGVDFGLHTKSRRLRHAACAVIVAPATDTPSAGEVAVQLRFALFVARVRLIIAEAGAPKEEKCQ
ncbi:hypothetical protein EGR_08576 [Echinococcus granulosus]|uniref:Uncharacterized protein n=1 Tax=Echinococcus granulosus TaxID=6210 RepID=W6U607_ECHGR|nr:hypothetical protein EGR_08576 [Echinococcus granulosus]EUB56550.1 hypothetical protein EGR_08576 [Echinococcus granulosus]